MPPAKGGSHRQGLGRSRGGFTSKLHIRGNAHGLPIDLHGNIFGWPAATMVPVIAESHLRLGPGATGVLASMDGTGALIGAALIAWLARPAAYPWLYVGGTALYMGMLKALALAPGPLLAALALLMAGLGSASFAVTPATLVYLAAPGELRSHALGVLSFSIGLGLIGFLHVGLMAELLAARIATIVIGLEGLVALFLVHGRWPERA